MIIVNAKCQCDRDKDCGGAYDKPLSSLFFPLSQHAHVHLEHHGDHTQGRVSLQRPDIRAKAVRFPHGRRITLCRRVPGTGRSVDDIRNNIIPSPAPDKVLHFAVHIRRSRAVGRAHDNKKAGALQPRSHSLHDTGIGHLLVIDKNGRDPVREPAPLLPVIFPLQCRRKTVIIQSPV